MLWLDHSCRCSLILLPPANMLPQRNQRVACQPRCDGIKRKRSPHLSPMMTVRMLMLGASIEASRTKVQRMPVEVLMIAAKGQNRCQAAACQALMLKSVTDFSTPLSRHLCFFRQASSHCPGSQAPTTILRRRKGLFDDPHGHTQGP
jgi:hypothetical protein